METTNACGDFKISLTVDDRFTQAERDVILNAARTCRIHKTLTSAQTTDIGLAP